MKLGNLDELLMDALREVGNIGAGNAATALATLTDAPLNMAIPRVCVVPLCAFAAMLGGPEALATCIYSAVEGDAPSHIAFVLKDPSAMRLADALLMLPPGTTAHIGELEGSALREAGNILTGAYLMALCELTGLRMVATPPVLASDMLGAILSTLAVVMFSLEEDDSALAIVTELGGPAETMHGYLVCLPESASIATMMHVLGLEY